MIKHMTDYFTAEKQESLAFVLVGVIAIAIALWLWTNGHRFKAMAYPLVLIAMIQLAVGGTVYVRTDRQLAHLIEQSVSAPAVFKQTETARMQAVMTSFSLYKAIEIFLLVAGILLAVVFSRYDAAAGVGAGLVLQSALMLGLDLFAEARGKAYLAALTAFTG